MNEIFSHFISFAADILPHQDDLGPAAVTQFQPYPASSTQLGPAHFDRADPSQSEVSDLKCHQNIKLFNFLLIRQSDHCVPNSHFFR